MEESLQRASNEHRTLYYSSQIKVMDISQNIRAFGTKFTNNEVKTVTLESFNLFCILEKIFQEAGLKHIYQLAKTINQNYNSVIAILLERESKLNQAIVSKGNKIQKQEDSCSIKIQEVVAGQTNLMREIKKNRLGGIHLFNENYARYLEDHRIMDQIKMEKGKRLHRNRLQILRQSIFQELNHRTDVEEFPAKNDQITNYIIKSKDKNSIFNYVSYEPELQQILTFFQNSQSEANDFLIRKVGKVTSEDGTFSFSDFQRDIQMKNYTFKKQIVQKFKEFIQKYRKKQEEMEKYLSGKQAFFKALQQKYFKMQQVCTQTDLNLDEYLKTHEQQLKQVQIKCQALETMKKEELNNNQKEGKLIHQLAIRENYIEKLNYKLAQLQSAIEYVKKLLRQQKTKKSYSLKEEPPKTQKLIQQSTQKEKQKSVVDVRQSGDIVQTGNEEILDLNSTTQIRKSSYMSSTWRRKPSNDGLSLMSFNELERDNRDHEPLARTEKKKYVRYHVESKYTQSDKSQGYMNKPKTTQSTENFVQTDFKTQECHERSNLRETHQKLEALPEEIQYDRKSSKKNKITPSSTPKISSKNVDAYLNKISNEKLTDSSKGLKARKNITSLTKIKSYQELSQAQSQSKRGTTKQKPKKSAKKGVKKSIKDQNPFKKQQIKLDRLDFNQQQRTYEEKQQQQKMETSSVDSVLKNVEKKEQTYNIFEVVEEQDEQKQTIRNTQRSQKMSSIYSHKRLEFELMDKLNRELNRIKQQKHYTIYHLYNLTILPFQRHKYNKSGNDFKAHHGFDDPPRKGKSELDNVDTNNLLKIKNKEAVKPLLAFDDLIKNMGPDNQIKTQKLKNWKKKMMSNMKAQLISQQQADQILSVIQQSIKSKDNGIKSSAIVSHIASIGNNVRNSLSDLQNVSEAKFLKRPSGLFRKIKLKTSCEDTEESIVNIDKFEDKLGVDIQQKIEDLIQFEALHPNFVQKFAILHKRCQQGAICSHINKYFETIMKHYEQRRKKGKQTLVLPIEQIGNRIEAEQNAQKQNKLSPRRNDNKDHLIQRDVSLGKGKNIGLTRQRLSQQLLLPNIKDSKIPKTSKVTY